MSTGVSGDSLILNGKSLTPSFYTEPQGWSVYQLQLPICNVCYSHKSNGKKRNKCIFEIYLQQRCVCVCLGMCVHVHSQVM